MAGITLELAETQLALYISAEAAVLTGQSYEINGRKLTRANLADIHKGIEMWRSRINGFSAPYTRRSRVIEPAG